MRVLVFGAHPDDAELYCGGTLALCARRGDEISIVTVTDGRAGAGGPDGDEKAKVRRREAEAAAAVVGASLVWMGERDLELFESDRVRRQFVEVVRESRPDIVMAHSPKDYHPDHRAVAKLSLDACFISTVGGYDAGPPMDTRPVFYNMDAMSGIGGGVPDEFVDITDVIDTKREMFDKHASQGDVVETDAGKLWDVTEVQSRFRGAQCGVVHAEAFSHPEGWLRRVPKRVLP